jgi:predicted regulator of amino acid metabolism with ACT domain
MCKKFSRSIERRRRSARTVNYILKEQNRIHILLMNLQEIILVWLTLRITGFLIISIVRNSKQQTGTIQFLRVIPIALQHNGDPSFDCS